MPAQPEADLEFSSRSFRRLKSSSLHSKDTLLPAFSVLGRYCKSRPNDPTGLHLFGLICETLGLSDLSGDSISQAISILESSYEESENAEIEKQFTIAHSNMARLRLSLQDYTSAIDSFESALGLLPENDDADATTSILRTHAQFGLGLANFKLGSLETAISFFESALESAGENQTLRGQVTVLLAQAMWKVGTEDFKETAKAQLLEW